MLEVKNLLFQPLVLNLADSNKSIHLAPRGKATIKENELSQEIRKLEAKGWMKVISEKKQKLTTDNRQQTTSPDRRSKK